VCGRLPTKLLESTALVRTHPLPYCSVFSRIRTGTQSLCVAIRQSAPGIPIIVLGSDIDVRTKVALFELGADDYMVRPVDSSEMLARLRAVIRRSRWAFESS
jgi:PleD family two-component response regulator